MKKHLLLLVFIGTLCASCFTRKERLTATEPVQEKQLNLITNSGFDVKISRSKYIGFLREQISEGNAVNTFDSLLKTDTLNIASLYADREHNRDIYAETDRFIIQELGSGQATVIDPDSNKKITGIKKITKYFKQSAIVRGNVRSVYFYSGKKVIFGKMYGRPHF